MRCVEVIASTPHPGISGVSWHSDSMIAQPPMPLLLNHDPLMRIGTVFNARLLGDRVMVRSSVSDAYVWARIVDGGSLAASACVSLHGGFVRGTTLYRTVLREVSLLLLRKPDNPECRVTRAWTVDESPAVAVSWW